MFGVTRLTKHNDKRVARVRINYLILPMYAKRNLLVQSQNGMLNQDEARCYIYSTPHRGMMKMGL